MATRQSDNQAAIALVVEGIQDLLKKSESLTAKELATRLGYPMRGIESILGSHPLVFARDPLKLDAWRIRTGKTGNINEYAQPKNGEGLLSYMGYSVGHRGLSMSKRHDILDRVMGSELPKVISAEYMAGWSKPRTQDRLRKLADSLAAFRSDRERKTRTNNDESIRDWTADLAYLKQEYWDKSWNWRWPC